MDTHATAQRWFEAAKARDLAALDALASDDIVITYPQSGEVIRGKRNYLAMMEHYPASEPRVEGGRVHGDREKVSVTARSPFSMPVITVSGGSERSYIEGEVMYPDGKVWHVVGFIDVRAGQVVAETTYYAEPFDPPEWRAAYTGSPE